MEYVNFEKALYEMGEAIVSHARTGLGATRDRENRQTTWKRVGNGWQPLKTKTRKAKGKISSSGRLSDSLRAVVEPDSKGVPTLSIVGEDYGVTINEGRGPTRSGGTNEVFRKIKDWAKTKKVKPREMSTQFGAKFIKDTPASRNAQAFMIARKIHHFGYPARPFMNEAYDAVIPKYRDALKVALDMDFAQLIKDEL